MPNSNNVNILTKATLASPQAIRTKLPLTDKEVTFVLNARNEICDILNHRSEKFMMIVGPCSIHDTDGAIEYAEKLKKLHDDVQDRIMLIMRVYFEKPRTTVGWKGLIYDPDINSTYNIKKGIFMARRLLLDIAKIGLPVASEMLDPIIPQYIADAVSWAAIGARTTESQTHRQLASGLSMPVGFKNATDGTFQAAIDAINTACSPHSFIGVTEEGQIGVFHTKGNRHGHIVLRGGGSSPNYTAEYIAFLKVALKKAAINPAIIVDCSHANSGKKFNQQKNALYDVMEQIAEGEKAIVGMMLESNLKEGSQKLLPGKKPEPGISVTDACISWEETEELVRHAYDKLQELDR